MTGARVGALVLLCGGLGTSMLCAADLSNYRGFQFGMNVSAAAKPLNVIARTKSLMYFSLLGIEYKYSPRRDDCRNTA